ncbi:MAG: hypothetical protein GF346_11560, partial [Candidatus Eisenbacteria bacterium]|nr:hypothetical protein [Candidatus Latescibacterota bacterium]MBD3303073.1 hypothetical protein [Candidatus Eisenbacteria bacterium]
GVDWRAVHDRYEPLVDRVASRGEFSDLMWEMQGELGTSHCYELGGDYRPEPAYLQGFLGADLELDARSGAWRIARIPRGDSWDERRSSPLAAPGLGVSEGDEILAVGGGSSFPLRAAFAAAFSPSASCGGAPGGCGVRVAGSNGETVSAASGISIGTDPLGKPRSKYWLSYTGSKIRSEMK